MEKAVQLLSYGHAAHVTEFLQHIQCMVNHEILPGETFQEHFDRFLENFKGDPDSHEAIKKFIADQDESVLIMLPWDAYEFGDIDDVGNQYHNFDIFDLKHKA